MSEQQASPVADLGASLTIPEVTEALDRLRALLDQGDDPLRLQGSGLEQVDGAGVQLLCALVKGARDRGRAVIWEGASPTLRAAAGQLGLERALGW